MSRLDNKAAFITGAGSGIGEEIARSFAQQGANVAVADINFEAASRVAESIGDNAFPIQIDVSEEVSVKNAIADVIAKFGKLDHLVNNAGIGLVGNVEETSLEDWNRLLKVNMTGVFLCTKLAIPHLLSSGKSSIINIASVAGLVGIERRFAYSATKGAVVAITRELAIDYVTTGLRVNAICPGTVYSPFVEGYLRKNHAHELEETIAKLNARQPVGRMGRPDEIAKMAVYLASEEAEFVTGSIMTIDGGLTAR